MNSEKFIQKIKSGSDEDLEKIRLKLEEMPKNEKGSRFLKAMIDNLNSFSKIDREENKIVFIQGLKALVGDWGREYFPVFSEFIINQIEDDSEKVRREVIELADLLTDQIAREELSEREKEVLAEFIDGVIILMENYYYQTQNENEDVSISKYESLEALMEKIIKEDRATVPQWLDCTWKREICSNSDCPICSKIIEIEKITGSSAKSQFLIEVMDDGDELKKDCPAPEEFPFYLKVENWMNDLSVIAEESKRNGEFWIFTEAAADLFWYLSVLNVKIYRQLCNRFLADKGVDRSFDYRYNRKVIIKSIKKIKKAMQVLNDSGPERGFKKSIRKLERLEERIYNI